MRLLLDTHILVWWATDDSRLPPGCRRLLLAEENEVFFSSICIWEVAMKFSKIPPEQLRERSLENGLRHLAFSARHAAEVAQLPPHHQDPFDRALLAQALVEPMVLVSQDTIMQSYSAQLRYF